MDSTVKSPTGVGTPEKPIATPSGEKQSEEGADYWLETGKPRRLMSEMEPTELLEAIRQLDNKLLKRQASIVFHQEGILKIYGIKNRIRRVLTEKGFANLLIPEAVTVTTDSETTL